LLATFGRIRRTLAGRGGHSKWRNHHGCEQSHEREFFHDEILLDIPTAGKPGLHDRRNTSLAAIRTCFNRRTGVAAAEPGRNFHPPRLFLREFVQNVPQDAYAETQAGRKFFLRRGLAIWWVAKQCGGNMLAELAVALPLRFVEKLFCSGLLGKRGMLAVVSADVDRLPTDQRG